MPTKLLIVMPSAHPHGGAEEALMQLLVHREAAGLALSVIFLEEGLLVERTRALGIPAAVVASGRLREPDKFLRAIGAIRAAIRREKPDAILGWMTKAHIYGGLAALGTPTPALYFQMGLPDHGVVDRLSRHLPAAGALACSDFAAAEQQALVRHPVRGVALAADTRRFSAALGQSPGHFRRQLGLDPDRPLVGIVGRLQRWKGMHIFAKAMARVLADLPEARGVIVGGVHAQEADYEPWLRARLAELNLGDRVRMVGAQKNVPEWMQAMDIVVHASEREPFGIVVVEAMALGKPVIATVPGGPAEILRDGVDGLLVPFDDPAALARAIRRYLEDGELRARCAASALGRSGEYTAEAFALRTARAVHALLGRG